MRGKYFIVVKDFVNIYRFDMKNRKKTANCYKRLILSGGTTFRIIFARRIKKNQWNVNFLVNVQFDELDQFFIRERMLERVVKILLSGTQKVSKACCHPGQFTYRGQLAEEEQLSLKQADERLKHEHNFSLDAAATEIDSQDWGGPENAWGKMPLFFKK